MGYAITDEERYNPGGVINLLSEKCYGSDNFIPAFFQQTTSDAFFDSIPSLGRIIDELLFL